jgi:hypothetical protein
MEFTNNIILLVLDLGVIVTDSPFGTKALEEVTKLPTLVFSATCITCPGICTPLPLVFSTRLSTYKVLVIVRSPVR